MTAHRFELGADVTFLLPGRRSDDPEGWAFGVVWRDEGGAAVEIGRLTVVAGQYGFPTPTLTSHKVPREHVLPASPAPYPAWDGSVDLAVDEVRAIVGLPCPGEADAPAVVEGPK